MQSGGQLGAQTTGGLVTGAKLSACHCIVSIHLDGAKVHLPSLKVGWDSIQLSKASRDPSK